MNRRKAAAGLASLWLAACGGGGGGGVPTSSITSEASATGTALPAAAAPPPPPPPPPPQVQPHIALWGDSLTGPMGFNLAQISGNRQIFNGGISGETSVQIANRAVADTGHDDWINVYWYGHNNQTQAAQIKTDIARSVASLAPGNTRFLVLSVVNQATPVESRGGADYATILQLNADLAAAYPQNYLDIRGVLVGNANTALEQDRNDLQADVPPSSLRFDAIHLNNEGSELVARRVLDYIANRGW